jgi:hypothetical protein
MKNKLEFYNFLIIIQEYNLFSPGDLLTWFPVLVEFIPLKIYNLIDDVRF